MEKLIDLIKPLIEKYLFTTVSSVALAILGVALLPDIFKLKEYVGSFLYGVLLFCICFLITNLIKHLVNGLKNKRLQFKIEKQQKDLIKTQEEMRKKQELEELWCYVDKLSPLDKRYLQEFLNNSNTPIEVDNLYLSLYPSGLLSNTNVIVSTKKQKNFVDVVKKINLDEDELMRFALPIDTFSDYSTHSILYKLKDEFYDLLKYSYEQYGKISHFDFKENSNGKDEDAHAE